MDPLILSFDGMDNNILDYDAGYDIEEYQVPDSDIPSFQPDVLEACYKSGWDILDFIGEDIFYGFDELNFTMMQDELNVDGMESDNFGFVEEFEKEAKVEQKIEKDDTGFQDMIKSAIEFVKKSSDIKLESNSLAQPNNNMAIARTKNSPQKSKQKPKTSKLRSEYIKLNTGGKYRPQLPSAEAVKTECDKVMAEHSYVVKRGGKGSKLTSSSRQNLKNNDQKKSPQKDENTFAKFILALDKKPSSRPTPMPRKDASNSCRNAKPKPAPVPRKPVSIQDNQQKPKLAPIPRKDSSASINNSDMKTAPRKMTSILDISKLNHENKTGGKIIPEPLPEMPSGEMHKSGKNIEYVEDKSVKNIHCTDNIKSDEILCKENQFIEEVISEEQIKSDNEVTCVADDAVTGVDQTMKLMPLSNKSDNISSPCYVEPTNEESQAQLDQNETADSKKKKLSLKDYKRLVQERVKPDNQEEQEQNDKTTNRDDHSYCLPVVLQQVPKMEASHVKNDENSSKIDEPLMPVEIRHVKLKDVIRDQRQNKVFGGDNILTVQNMQRNEHKPHPMNAQNIRDHRRGFDYDNFRKRKASTYHENVPTKRPTTDHRRSDNSWNSNVLNVFELPGRRSNKCSNSAGFPSDASSVSSSSRRGRSSSSDSSSSEDRCYRRRHSRSKSPNDRGARRSEEHQKAIDERRIIYIGGLPPDYTKCDLERKMQRFGDVLSTSIHKRNKVEFYGFVTFASSAEAANAKQDGHRVPGCERFDFSYGGRREFCGTSYADLDNEAVYKRSSKNNSQNSDFQDLLRQTMSMVQKSKRKS